MEELTINRGRGDDRLVARMLRYLERVGLIRAGQDGLGLPHLRTGRAAALRTLRELLARFDCGLSDVAFAKRMSEDGDLSGALESWFEEEPERPEEIDPANGSAGSRRSTSACSRPRPRRTMEATTATRTDDFKVADLSPRRLRPQGDHARRARDARPDATREEFAARSRCKGARITGSLHMTCRPRS
jgi:hypothetical protein